MPNGSAPNPRDLQIIITGKPFDVTSWRTAPFPATHTADQNYRISADDADRIVQYVKQLLAPITAARVALGAAAPAIKPLGATEAVPAGTIPAAFLHLPAPPVTKQASGQYTDAYHRVCQPVGPGAPTGAGPYNLLEPVIIVPPVDPTTAAVTPPASTIIKPQPPFGAAASNQPSQFNH